MNVFSREEIEKKVLELAAKIFKDKELTLNSILGEAKGYDSMEHVQFLLDLEKKFAVEITDVEILRHNTFQEIVEILLLKQSR